ncbi:MAG: tetratricopeptide repeat protein [Bacteroidetes bacterium]|nr:tetratricopeptide repeat protein [Bacteroidota bacterium]MDA0888327.1 tetratricopeptide repeat protein [Bacteroidota bacterium]MDA1084644.1 tetratricopeptide repeat protein [Bacteroidota bacterium]
MATYKKRGGKNKSAQQAPEQDSVTAEVFTTLDTSAGRAEAWVARYQNYILTGIGAIVVIVLAYLAYMSFVLKPLNEESTNAMAQAQSYFKQGMQDPTVQDSLFVLALEGDGVAPGFVEIIENYGRSDAGQLATYNAGMISLQQGDFDQAIAYLDNFSTADPLLGALALGGIGDAFTELNQLEDALGYYQKAASFAENNLTTPRFLLKGAQVALAVDKNSVALDLLENLKENYASAPEASKVAVLSAQAKN